MNAGERALATVLEGMHPARWRRNLRRQIDELMADQARLQRDHHAARTAELAAALSERRHSEQLLIEAAGVLCGSGHRFSPGQVGLLLRNLSVTDDGRLDEHAFEVRAFEEAATFAGAVRPQRAVGEEEAG